MSDAVADHGYLPEEHAPDPVYSHGDPTVPGKVGIWLFLASEIMFFVGILGSYIILRSASPEIFANHAATLSKPLAATAHEDCGVDLEGPERGRARQALQSIRIPRR